MLFWIDGHPYHPQTAETEQIQISGNEHLRAVFAFTRFWFSQETHWNTFTSGSTSDPKPIKISRNQIISSARSSLDFFHFDAEKDGFVLCLSAGQTGGFMVLARAFLGNIDVFILPPSSKPINEKGLPDFRKWFVSMVPMQFHHFLKLENVKQITKNWKGILLGGAPVSQADIEPTKQLACTVYHSYGMTETVSHIAIRQLHPNLESNLSQIPFQVLDGIQVRTDESQCLEIKGAVTENQWITTKDNVEFTALNQFIFLSRTDRFINSGGLKINPELVKKILTTILPTENPDFEILGIPDAEFGERVALVFFEPNQEFFRQYWFGLRWDNLVASFTDTKKRPFLPAFVFLLPNKPLTISQKTDYPTIRKILTSLQPVWDKGSPKSA